MSDDEDSAGALVAKAGRGLPPEPQGEGRRGGNRGRRLPVVASERAVAIGSWSASAPHAQILLDMRRRRKQRFFGRLALFVGVPTAATLAYTLLLASPRYTSEFEATYQTFRAPETLSAGLAESFSGTSQNNSVDLGTILYEYVRSPALLTKIDQELHLRDYYSNPRIDFLSRLPANASSEKFLNYYRQHVSVAEGLGGYVTVDVQAFDPQFAQTLARAVVAACDAMVDGITARARQDEMKFAEDELAREETRVRQSRLALAEFQNAHGDQDPERMAAQLGTIVGGLETDLTAARAQLAASQRDLAPTSPIIVQLKTRISALEEQLKEERARLANTGGSTPYSVILEQYSALQMEQEFAKNAYLSAQQGLAVARADAARKQNYMVDFAPPSVPDQATISIPIYYTVSVFLGSLIVFGFGSLVAGAFRDQAGI